MENSEIQALQHVVDKLLINLFAAAAYPATGDAATAFDQADEMLAESKRRGHCDVADLVQVMESA